MLRRKRLPPELRPAFAAFTRVLELTEAAKSCLTEVVPTTRMPGRPLADALAEFDDLLARAQDEMAAWRIPPVERAWDAASRGIEASRRRAEELRATAPDLGGFEGLIWAVEQLMDPLDAFREAETGFKALRTSPK